MADAQNRVTKELACVKCGQDLRNYELTADCPSCGHPILESVLGDSVARKARSAGLGMADAVRVVIYAAVVLGVLIGIAALSQLFATKDFVTSVERAFDTVFDGALIFSLPAIVGIVLLLPRQPAIYYKVRYLNPRRLRRFGLILLPIVALGVLGIIYAHAYVAPLGSVLWAVLPSAVLLRRMERLMCELPSFKLARYAFAVLIGALLFGAACYGVKLLTLARLKDPDYEGALTGVTITTLVLGTILAIAGLNLLVRVRGALAEGGR